MQYFERMRRVTTFHPFCPNDYLSETDSLDAEMVREVTNAIYKDWRTIAYSLHMTKEDVECIEKKKLTEKDRTEQMLKIWQKKERGYDKISLLAEACRACNFNELASELDQGT